MRINYNCWNYDAPKGSFGGAMCMCKKCIDKRAAAQKLISDKEIQEAASGCS